MVRIKLLTVMWVFIISLPKFLSLSPSSPEIDPQIKEVKAVAIIKVPVKTTPIKPINVSASVYFPVKEQTDDSPLITADGSHIKKKKPSKHRWIAVSRNLLSRWGGPINYGDTLRVKGISKKLDGHYVVRDTMKKQIRNRIDILVGSEEKIMGFWEDVKIYQMN